MIELTPLDPSALSASAQRALGPGAGRLMAAKGTLPLAPNDQVAVLYQLSLDNDQAIAQSARGTASGLPENLLVGTLGGGALDPRILHFFGTACADKSAVFDAVVLNPAVADATLVVLAAKGDARGVDQIAQNEQRLLAHPEIIAAMYMNRRARMSTIDRVVELAVRNHVRVPGLACWDEVARALEGGHTTASTDDALFSHATAVLADDDSHLTTGDAEAAHEEKEEVVVKREAQIKEKSEMARIMEMSVPAKIRLATVGNGFARSILIRDPLKMVAQAAIKSPGVTDIEAARYATNQALPEEVIRYISTKREWTKMYGVKVSLCKNPKTPVAEASKLLTFLREKDLNNVTKSKGVSSALVAQAKKIMAQRKGGTAK